MKEQILKEIEQLKAKHANDLEKNQKRNTDEETKKKRIDFLTQKFESELRGLEAKLKALEVEADETYSLTEAEEWIKKGRELLDIVRVDTIRKLYRFKKGKKK